MPQQEYKKGLSFKHFYSKTGRDPMDVVCEKRNVEITDYKGNIIFNMKGLEFPKDWSENACKITANMYFKKAGVPGTGNETSVKQVFHRIANCIKSFGRENKYFDSDESSDIFEAELKRILIEQRASFNSPVWFNFGLYEQYGIEGHSVNWYYDITDKTVKLVPNRYIHPQGSACFINPVEDSMEGIMHLAKVEALLFKGGSGTGTNLSTLRGAGEKLSGGGASSGVMSFYNLFDSVAGAIKSGGATRRAAKMTILNIDHPEIIPFIKYKADNEMFARALAAFGYSTELDGEIYKLVNGQNSNFSVRVADDFINSVLKGGTFFTREITTGNIRDEHDSQQVFEDICVGVWECGDPGLQFDTTINKWNTCKISGRINASNPCSEFMFLDNTACNLVSINLMKFLNQELEFDIEAFRKTVDVLITSQEVIVDYASYPKKEMSENSHLFRPLGLGYANLGALLMVNCLPYDSDEGRALAAAITALLTGRAYKQSAVIASEIGAFEKYEENKDSMLEVIKMHLAALEKIPLTGKTKKIIECAREDWEDALRIGMKHGFRNAQVTLLAPTGTIGLQMDCDTTGVEPDYSLIKYKKIIDGSALKIVNQSIPKTLRNLNYSEEEIASVIDYILGNEEKGIDMHGTVEGAPHLKKQHYAIFDCANKPPKGNRVISPMGHIKMMAAVQPFLSGAISKTVNFPNEATVDDIKNAYISAWKLGLKAIALYRDGSKVFQPLATQGKQKTKQLKRGQKEPLPPMRKGLTARFEIEGEAFFIRTGEYKDGRVGEIFLDAFKVGSEYGALLHNLAVTISKALQRGVPLKNLVDTFLHTRFQPSGVVDHAYIKHCSSIMDFVGRFLGLHYLGMTELAHIKPHKYDLRCNQVKIENAVKDFFEYKKNRENGFSDLRKTTSETEDYNNYIGKDKHAAAGGPPCKECSTPTIKTGHCYTCPNCGLTSGCG